MKGKGSRLAILLALVLTLVGAFSVTAFAEDQESQQSELRFYTGEGSQATGYYYLDVGEEVAIKTLLQEMSAPQSVLDNAFYPNTSYNQEYFSMEKKGSDFYLKAEDPWNTGLSRSIKIRDFQENELFVVNVKCHEHEWTVSTSADHLTAEINCDEPRCSTNPDGYEVAFNAEDADYDPEGYTGATVTQPENLPEGVTVGSIEYSVYGEGSYSTEIPVDPGHYYARVKVSGDNTDYLRKGFWINKKVIHVVASDGVRVYDGKEPTADELTYTVTETDLEDKVVPGTLTIDPYKHTVGEYDIVQNDPFGVTDDTHYEIDFTSGTYSITQATNVLTVGIEGWTEGETPNNPTYTTKYGKKNRVVIHYYDSEQKEIDPPTATTPGGDYFIQATMPATANYTAAETELVPFKIAIADNPVTFKVDDWIYGNDATSIDDFEIIASDGIDPDNFELTNVEFKRGGTQYKEWSSWETAGKTTPVARYVVRATIHDKTGTYADKTNVYYNDPGFYVTKRPLIVDIAPTYKEYKDEDPDFEPTANSETPLPDGVVIGDVVDSVIRSDGLDVGEYPFEITLTEGSAKNYDVTANPENFRIVPKKLEVKTILDKDSWKYRQECGTPDVVQINDEPLPEDTGWTITYKYRPADSTSEDDWKAYPTSDGVIPVDEYTLRAEIEVPEGSSYVVNTMGSEPDCDFEVTPSNLIVTAQDYSDVYKPDDGIASDGVIIGDAKIERKSISDKFDEDEVREYLTVEAVPDWDSPVDKYLVGLGWDYDKEGSQNYDVEFINGEYKITKRPLKITLSDGLSTEYGTLKVFGKEDIVVEPYGEKKDSGLAEDESVSDLSGSLTFNTGTYNDEYSPAMKYLITPDGYWSDNYAIEYVGGLLEVTKKELVLTWTTNFPDDPLYGLFHRYDGKELVVTASSDGILDGDVSEGVKIQLSNNKATNVKRFDNWGLDYYEAEASLPELRASANYTIKNPVRSYMIYPVKLTLTPEDNTVVYGNAVVDKGFTGEGFVNGEDVSVVEGTPKFTYGGYAPGQPVGNYDIAFDDQDKFDTLDGLHAQNYDLVTPAETGTLTVTPRPVSIQWGNTVGLIYNGTDQAPGRSVDNAFGNDAVRPSTVVIKDSKGNVVKQAVDAGTYTATVTAVDNDNYTTEKGENLTKSFTIGQATVTVTADDQTIFYGQDYDKSKVSYTGWQGSDSASILTAVPTVTSTYFVNAKYGTYKLNPSGAAAKNYTFKYDDGVLTVNNKVTTLVAKAAPSGSKATLSWNKVTGAKKYEVYFNKCNSNGKEYSCKKIATVKTNKFKKKGLKKGTCYKFYVVAKDANGKTIAKSKTGHFVAGGYNDSYTNAKSLKVSPSSISLNNGATKKIKVSQNKAKSGRILLDGGHSPLLRFRSSNTKVATVSSKGVVKAVGKGYCEVYVQATNGMWKKVAVTVK